MIKDPRSRIHQLNKDEAFESCGKVASGIAKEQQRLRLLRERHSPVKKLMEQLMYGEQYPISHQPTGGTYHILTLMIAASLRANLHDHAGKVAVDRERTRIMANVMKSLEMAPDTIDLP